MPASAYISSPVGLYRKLNMGRVSGIYRETDSDELENGLAIAGLPETLAIAENGNSGAIEFTLYINWPIGDVSLDKSSSNPTLIPVANIVFGGSGYNRTVTITPAASQTGTGNVTITLNNAEEQLAVAYVIAVTVS